MAYWHIMDSFQHMLKISSSKSRRNKELYIVKRSIARHYTVSLTMASWEIVVESIFTACMWGFGGAWIKIMYPMPDESYEGLHLHAKLLKNKLCRLFSSIKKYARSSIKSVSLVSKKYALVRVHQSLGNIARGCHKAGRSNSPWHWFKIE